MENILIEEDIRQAFSDMAIQIEKACGDQQNGPESNTDRASIIG